MKANSLSRRCNQVCTYLRLKLRSKVTAFPHWLRYVMKDGRCDRCTKWTSFHDNQPSCVQSLTSSRCCKNEWHKCCPSGSLIMLRNKLRHSTLRLLGGMTLWRYRCCLGAKVSCRQEPSMTASFLSSFQELAIIHSES